MDADHLRTNSHTNANANPHTYCHAFGNTNSDADSASYPRFCGEIAHGVKAVSAANAHTDAYPNTYATSLAMATRRTNHE